MIVWSGWGILTVLIAAVVGGLTAVLAQMGLHSLGQDRWFGLALAVGLGAAAAVNWWVGRSLNRRPGREMIDTATGRTVVLRRVHSLFFIRMEWWSAVLALGAAVALVATISGWTPSDPAPRGGTGRHGEVSR